MATPCLAHRSLGNESLAQLDKQRQIERKGCYATVSSYHHTHSYMYVHVVTVFLLELRHAFLLFGNLRGQGFLQRRDRTSGSRRQRRLEYIRLEVDKSGERKRERKDVRDSNRQHDDDFLTPTQFKEFVERSARDVSRCRFYLI
jgi:hypothetical protein